MVENGTVGGGEFITDVLIFFRAATFNMQYQNCQIP